MICVPAAASPAVPVAAAGGPSIPVGNVLVVTARPGQESADLGGVLYAFRRSGACLGLLCLTRGEASPLNSTWSGRLEAVRPWELQLAAIEMPPAHQQATGDDPSQMPSHHLPHSKWRNPR